jgi:hypothetical protein
VARRGGRGGRRSGDRGERTRGRRSERVRVRRRDAPSGAGDQIPIRRRACSCRGRFSVISTDAREDTPRRKNAFEEFFEESAEEAPEEAWADAVADARDTRDPRGAAAAALSSESGDGSSRDDETKSFLGTPHAETSAQTPSPLDAFVGRASRLERLVRLEKGVAAARNRAFQRDVAAWQPVGTSLYIGERAETATPTRARRVSSPSPSPPPPDPAPAVPFLPETPNVLASEENGGSTPRLSRRGLRFSRDPARTTIRCGAGRNSLTRGMRATTRT